MVERKEPKGQTMIEKSPQKAYHNNKNKKKTKYVIFGQH